MVRDAPRFIAAGHLRANVDHGGDTTGARGWCWSEVLTLLIR
ncbi:hypothetical protein MBRU_12235 [Mycolicibacterium brumae DSM 44177]|nr:hypothetical protein MBRU_12235 [Mycolicibacterium brumae DSM 44177]